ncbi:MAG: N-acetylmuramoyl-L-alanine amidase [Ruminococcaceae bacterium]|nr:N-acetylmuramoyl-L-alanine amidase [Oscillospiraceae bacterium]
MKKDLLSLWPMYCAVFLICMILAVSGSRAVTAWSENQPVRRQRVFVIDAGHGGEDGGAVSCTGVPESRINLQIALRLRDLMHLMGYGTYMIRTTDTAVYTEGKTVAEKKISDLKNRVKLVNAQENPILVSIHQNYFGQSRYCGAQVFYNRVCGAEELAAALQSSFLQTLNPGSNRQCKPSSNVYLMEHIQCPGILVECGFLSNAAEEALLRREDYQKKLCCVIAAALAQGAN